MDTAVYDETIKGLHAVFHDYRHLLCWPVVSKSFPSAVQCVSCLPICHCFIESFRCAKEKPLLFTCIRRSPNTQVPKSLHKYGKDRKLILTAHQLGRCFWNSSEKGWAGVALRREILQPWNPSCTQLPAQSRTEADKGETSAGLLRLTRWNIGGQGER